MENSIYQKELNTKNVLLFIIPTMIMIVIQSLFGMIDGVFISNYMGTDALSALTLISPYFNILTAIAAMFASGGSAVVMKKMGEGKELEARQDFTMLLIVNVIIGALLTIGGTAFVSQLSGAFGASAVVTTYCKNYLFTYIIFIVPALLFSNLQMYTIASGGTKLAMVSSIIGGVCNIVLDFVFIKICGFGMMGAALASGIGMTIPCIIIAIYLINKNRMLHFVFPRFRGRVLLKAVTNGASEFSSNLVSGIVILLFNHSMLKYAGESGVAASTIIFYIFGFMNAVYMGYMMGASPMFSYFYGEQNQDKMKRLKKISLGFIFTVSLITTAFSIFGSDLFVSIFADPDDIAYELAIHGNKLFSAALLLVGFNTLASSLFTALGNGFISAVISFSRTFIFLAGSIIILPLFLGIDGLWLSVPVAECIAIILSVFFVKKYQAKYRY
ncbi:MAG: MATE family efflux transporter [Clostridiales bacterium]|nr:MATE family efflux transporter [Clostridiales bacterium]